MPWAGDQDSILDEIQEFLTGARLGDRAWGELLTRHHAIVRKELERCRGREIDTAGDGFLAAFDGPARAVGCASRIRDGLTALGLEIRAGFRFADRGMHALRDIPRCWQLFAASIA